MSAETAVVIMNCAVFAMIAICTASVAYFAQSPHGLWSLLALLAVSEVRYRNRKE